MHMKFSEDSENNYFFSQPHQPFFILAFVNAIITMLIFLLSYKGILNIAIPSSHFHAYGLIYLLFTPAFLAFLFTTFPRFASTPVIEKQKYISVFSFYYLGSAIFVLGSIVSPILSAIGMIMVFVGHIMGALILKNIYNTTTMEDKHDIYWIHLAMRFGVFAHFLYIIAQLFYMPIMGLSTEISIYLYLFLLTFSVAQRMVPFFSHSMVGRNDHLMKVVFALLILHIVLEGFYTHSSFIVDILIGLLIGKELLRWKLQFPNLALDIHMLTLGFVFTILIGFGTRVTIGHSGNMMQADKWTTYLFYWTQIVVILRILVSLAASFGWNFMILFDITATAWIIMFIAWAVRFFAVLVNGKKLS